MIASGLGGHPGIYTFTGIILSKGTGQLYESINKPRDNEHSPIAITTIGFGASLYICFILGMFLDWIGIVMITFPVFLPIAEQLGFDKLWFVVSVAVMLQDSFLTPPFGYALFYLKGLAPPEISTKDIYWGAFPFWRLMELGLILVVVFPETITWLPSIIVK